MINLAQKQLTLAVIKAKSVYLARVVFCGAGFNFSKDICEFVTMQTN